MSKNTYSIVNVANNEVLNVQTAFPPCRDICRSFLTTPENFGVRLQVVKNRQEDGTGEVVFDVTSIKYSSGRVRMTLWTEFNRQQKMHEATAAKAEKLAAEKAAKKAAREAEKKAKAEAEAEASVKEETKIAAE
jgi:regulator of protease activity HflC (stomatin/prohibitin superfamily)